MGKREEILKMLETSHVAMMAQLNEIDKQRKIYPLWTIREIVAHLSGWDDAAPNNGGNGDTKIRPAVGRRRLTGRYCSGVWSA